MKTILPKSDLRIVISLLALLLPSASLHAAPASKPIGEAMGEAMKQLLGTK